MGSNSKRIERLLESSLGLFVLLLGTWTVVHQVALRVRVPVDVAVPVWALLSVTVAVGVARLPENPVLAAPVSPSQAGRRRMTPSVWAAVLAAAAGVFAVSSWAVPGSTWMLFWILASSSLLCGVWTTIGNETGSPVTATAESLGADWGARLVLGLGMGFGLLSLLVQRPDADDVYLVNRSTWVEQRGGRFPVRDTIFSDEVFADTRPSFPVTSIEALLGAVARWTPLSSPTVTYLVFGPIVAALSVVACWRLLRTLRISSPAVVTLMSCVFLLLNGALHASFGNLSFARSWQGKVVLLIVVLPVVADHAIRVGRDASRRSLACLVIANLAAVGLSTTGVVLGPAMTALGLTTGLVVSRNSQVIRIGLIAAAVPLLMLVGRSIQVSGGGVRGWLTDTAGALIGGANTSTVEPAALWEKVFGAGPVALVPTLSILLAWRFVRDRTARVFFTITPFFVVGVLFFPGVLDLLNSLISADSILWRMSWLMPVPIMFASIVSGVIGQPRWDLVMPIRVVTAVMLVAVLAMADRWVLSDGNIASSGSPRWKLTAEAGDISTRLIELAVPGSLVAGPVDASGAVTIRTTRVRTVNPRVGYAYLLRSEPTGLTSERVLITRALDGDVEGIDAAQLLQSLDALNVSAVCVTNSSAPLVNALQLGEFKVSSVDEYCEYWSRGLSSELD